MNTKNKINIGLLIAASALPNLQSDPSKLEPIYLSNVALYFNNEANLKKLPFVSKNGQAALDMLKRNPIPLTERNRHLFPNLETHVLFSHQESIEAADRLDEEILQDLREKTRRRQEAAKQAGEETPREKTKAEEEKEINEKKVVRVYGYPIDYDFFLQHKEQLRRLQSEEKYNISGIVFTRENQINHSEAFQQPIAGTNYFKYDIPNQITSLGDRCFLHCDNLQEITIPNSVSYLGDYCFADCWRLTTINIPEVVSSLGRHCFAFCFNLQEIIIPNSVTHLGEWCFMECRDLREINIPDSVTFLGDGCFSQCINLQMITISNNIKHIGELCFENCDNLHLITIIDTGNGNAENVEEMLRENLIASDLNPNDIQIIIIPQQQ